MNAGMRAKVNEGPCRLCGGAKFLTAHHVIPQSWFRRRMQQHRHSVDNIVPLCKHCHRLVEGHLGLDRLLANTRRREARRRLRAELTVEELLFVRRVLGRQWLDSHYPQTTANHDSRLALG